MKLKYIFISILLFILSLVIFQGIFTNIFGIVEGAATRNDALEKNIQNIKAEIHKNPIKGNNNSTSLNVLNEPRNSLVKMNIGSDVNNPQKIGKDACDQLNDSGKCTNMGVENCGYCQTSSKIIYGNDEEPLAGICVPSEKYPNPWLGPNDMNAEKTCIKDRERKMCEVKVKSCGDNSEDPNDICAWCPVKNIAMVKRKNNRNGYVPKYPNDDECDWDYEGEGLNGSLITGDTCSDFGTKYPCVGPKMKTGPHSALCLQTLWKKPVTEGFANGCKNTVPDKYEKMVQSNKKVLNNMNKIKKNAKKGNDYYSAKIDNRNCYDVATDPCEDRFGSKSSYPAECIQQIFKSSGCSQKSALNTNNNKLKNMRKDWREGSIFQDINNDFPIFNRLINGDSKGLTLRSKSDKIEYSNLVNYFKSDVDYNDINKQILHNNFCSMKDLKLPKKDCWYDFSLKMKSIKGIVGEYEVLDFKNGPNNFKSILPIGKSTKTQDPTSKHYSVFDKDYIIKQSVYEKQYFPFWDFIKAYETFWLNNWSEFKDTLSKVKGVKIVRSGNAEHIYFTDSPFDSFVKNLSVGGKKELYINKQMFQSKDFPYYYFIRIAKRN